MHKKTNPLKIFSKITLCRAILPKRLNMVSDKHKGENGSLCSQGREEAY